MSRPSAGRRAERAKRLKAGRWSVHFVLAGRYVVLRKYVSHVLVSGDEKTLCGGVRADMLCDVRESRAPTCPRCAARLERGTRP